jgi:hypothetical protein
MSERVGADMTHGALGSVTGALGLADIKPEVCVVLLGHTDTA